MNSKLGFIVASIVIPATAIVVGLTNKEIRCFFRLDSQEACQSSAYVDVDLIVQSEQFAPLENVEVRFITKGAPEVRRTDSNGYARVRIPTKGDMELILSKSDFETLRQIINLGNDPNRTRTYQLKKMSLVPKENGREGEKPEPYSESARLVGTWQADEFELGQQIRIFWQIQPNGISYFRFLSPNGVFNNSGTWQYSNGIIFESYSNGSSAKGSVKWVNDNHFELTILDNGVPAYTGIKRNYYRQTP